MISRTLMSGWVEFHNRRCRRDGWGQLVAFLAQYCCATLSCFLFVFLIATSIRRHSPLANYHDLAIYRELYDYGLYLVLLPLPLMIASALYSLLLGDKRTQPDHDFEEQSVLLYCDATPNRHDGMSSSAIGGVLLALGFWCLLAGGGTLVRALRHFFAQVRLERDVAQAGEEIAQHLQQLRARETSVRWIRAGNFPAALAHLEQLLRCGAFGRRVNPAGEVELCFSSSFGRYLLVAQDQ